ncbi:MAG: MurR/RpiR family transcriptional regulator [Phycisphaeraceae bacterium]|nr:MurR/RpiR family transcriptional regulator [Phycisphaeraceae bacterium]
MPSHTKAPSTSNRTSWQTIFRRLQPELTAAEKRAGAYFEAHPDAAHQSITEVVEESGIGYGTVIRFCQRMGCRGFQEFKIALARDGAANAASVEGLTGNDVSDGLRSDLFETVRLLDRDALQQVAEEILSKRIIQVIGVASSAPLALSLAWKLKRIGLDARPVIEGYVMAVDAFLLGEEDLLIAISSSGATKDILHTAEVAASHGAGVVAVTNYSNSPLSQIADIALYTSANRDPLKAEVPSLIPGEAVFEMLLDRVLELAPERQDHLVASFKAVSNRKV